MNENVAEEGSLAEEEEEEEEENLLFYCRCESAKSVSTLLSCLRQFASRVGGGSSISIPGTSNNNGDTQPSLSVMVDHLSSADGGRVSSSKKGNRSVQQVTVYAHPGGLTFHVHGIGRQSQASVDMQCGLFSEYSVSSEKIPTDGSAVAVDGTSNEEGYDSIVGGEFCVNLPTLIDSLHVLGLQNLDRTKACMSYNRKAAIFKVELEDRGVLATAAICGSVPEFQYDDDNDGDYPNNAVQGEEKGIATSSLAVAFRNHPVVARAIVKSDFFRSAVAELADIPGAITCTVGIAPDYIEIGTVGHTGECLVHLPKSSEAFTSLECNPSTLHMRSYHLYSLLQGMRGLDIAQETCMSINSNGMIAIQHQVLDVVGNSEANFIDFLMCAVQEEDDESCSDDEPQSSLTTKMSSTGRRSATQPIPDTPPEPVRTSRKAGGINRSEDTSSTDDDSDDADGWRQAHVGPSNVYENVVKNDSLLHVTNSRRSSWLQSNKQKTVHNNTKESSSSKRTRASEPREKRHQETEEEVSGKFYTRSTTTSKISQLKQQKKGRHNIEGCDSPEILFGATRLRPDDDSSSRALLLDNAIQGQSRYRDNYESETEEEEFN